MRRANAVARAPHGDGTVASLTAVRPLGGSRMRTQLIVERMALPHTSITRVPLHAHTRCTRLSPTSGQDISCGNPCFSRPPLFAALPRFRLNPHKVHPT